MDLDLVKFKFFFSQRTATDFEGAVQSQAQQFLQNIQVKVS